MIQPWPIKTPQNQKKNEVEAYIVREVAQGQKVLFIDMLQLTANWLAPQGEQATRQFFMADNTHFVEAGARQVASLFVDALTSYFLMKSLTPFYKE